MKLPADCFTAWQVAHSGAVRQFMLFLCSFSTKFGKEMVSTPHTIAVPIIKSYFLYAYSPRPAFQRAKSTGSLLLILLTVHLASLVESKCAVISKSMQ